MANLKRCLQAAVDLSDRDTARFMALFDEHQKDGLSIDESAKQAARDLVTELSRARDGVMRQIDEGFPEAVASKVRDYMTLDMFGEQEPAPVEKPAAVQVEATAEQMGLFIEEMKPAKAEVTADTPAYQALKQAAAALLPSFQSLIRSLSTEFGGEPKLAPLKGDKRALQKINVDYDGNVSGLKDMVRATIVAPDAATVTKIYKRVMAMPGAMKGGARNWFAGQTPDKFGYRDAKINLRFGDVIAELQISTQAMMDAKNGDGHKLYEKAREIEAQIKAEGREPTKAETAKLDQLAADSRALYAAAFESLAKAPGKRSSKPSFESSSESPPPLFGTDAGRGTSLSSATAPLPINSTTGTPSTAQNSKPTNDFIDTSNTNILPSVNPSVQQNDAIVSGNLQAEPTGKPAGSAQVSGEPGSPEQAGGRGASAGRGRDDADAGRAAQAGRDAGDGGGDGTKPGNPGLLPGAKRQRVTPYSAPRNSGLNFRITDADQIGKGGLRQKYKDNVTAIKLLKQIEAENRLATPEEQAVLAKFVGWGGFKNAFFHGRGEHLKSMREAGNIPDPGTPAYNRGYRYYESGQNEEWAKERREVLDLLTAEEYDLAAGSTPNAHYTAPQVITAMWDAVKRLGFKEGRVLEPAMGVGHFFGLMPDEMRNASAMAGVELDSITGRIAKQLYQGADIRVEGFEKAAFPDNFFDLAISNVPFGGYQVPDPKYSKYKLFIHDYFFLKALDRVRPGGLVAFITSDGTMDKLHPKVRNMIAKRAALVGAIRLPNNAFKENAATEVTTDVIFLRKLEEGEAPAQASSWADVKAISGEGKDAIKVNEYFVAHPEMMMGEMTRSGTMYGRGDQALVLAAGEDLAGKLATAIEKLPEGAFKPIEQAKPKIFEPVVVASGMKEGSLQVKDGQVYRVESGMLKAAPDLGKHSGLIEAAGAVRKAARDHFANQLSDTASEAQFQASMAALNKAYDGFVAKYGPINERAALTVLAEDSDLPLFAALEKFDKASGKFLKADVFSKRTVSKRGEVTKVETPIDALNVSLNERGRVDLDHMEKISGYSRDELLGALQDRLFQDPVTREWQTSDQYLAGSVREKLRDAEAAAKSEPAFKRNVEALKPMVPADVGMDQIAISLGQSWVPQEDIEAFAAHILGVRADWLTVSHVPGTADWRLTYRNGKPSSARATSEFGTEDFNAIELLEKALNLQQPTVWGEDGDGKKFVKPEATAAAREKQELIAAEFKPFLVSDEARAQRLAEIYNDRFNGFVLPAYNGAHLTLPGANPNIALRGNVKDGAWRIISSGLNVLLAHAVGAGKTFTMIAGGMELKRLGLVRKPMYVVPNHMLMQFSNEFLQLYPNANLLIASKEDLAKDRRKAMAARIATGDWDAVVITHSSFEKIPMSDAAIAKHIQEQIDSYEDAVLAASEKKEDTRLQKRLQKKLKDMKAKLEKLHSTAKKDDAMTFEELGVDQVFVDEAHYFKNLAFVTKMERVAGLTTSDAARSQDMFLKTQYLTGLHGGKRGVVFATGTPIANSVTEMYTMQRYLDMRGLKALGLDEFDNWASMFGQTVTKVEANPTGKGYRMHTRFAKFKNVPELMALFRRVADIKTPEMLKLPVPAIKGGKPEVRPSPSSQEQKDFVETLADRAEAIKKGQVLPHEDNMLKVTGDGRKASLDIRLVIPGAPDNPNSKANDAVRQIYRIWKDSTPRKASQLVFCDLSTPKGDGSFTVYEDIRDKLIKMGIPASEVQFIHDFPTDAKKDALFEKVRTGVVRVLLGSTDKMGAGTNVQKNLIAEHHLDAPWRPADVEQRDGRIVRQGNDNSEIELIRYVTEGTFDVYSWQTLETKAGFIGQVMRGDSNIRELEDTDGRALSYAEVKALAMGNPLVLEKVSVEAQIAKLSVSESNHHRGASTAKQEASNLQWAIDQNSEWIAKAEQDLPKIVSTRGDDFAIKLGGKLFAKRGDAADWLEKNFPKPIKSIGKPEYTEIGSIGGFKLEAVSYASGLQEIHLVGAGRYDVEVGDSWPGLVTRIENAMRDIESNLGNRKEAIAQARKKIEDFKALADKPFDKAQELADLQARLVEIDKELGIYQDDAGAEADGLDESVESPVASYGGVQTQRVYHGSRVDFDRFDDSKIGSGAGDQSLGRGHYFSGDQRLAQIYTYGEGKVREVEIPADEYLLRMDVALSDQSKHVRDALANGPAIKDINGKTVAGDGEPASNTVRGDSLAVLVRMKYGHKGGSAFFSKIGVKGYKYPADEDHQGVEKGTFNYVVFEGRDVQVDGGRNDGAEVRSKVMEYIPDEFKYKQRLGDFFNTKEIFNSWWHKTVGTQYHKAQRSEQFKRVFDLTQSYIAGVSKFANDAADRATTILPRFDKFSDLKRKPISKEDNEKLQKAVFDGTLLWTRDGNGRPVLVEDLRERAKGLTPEQKAKELTRARFVDHGVMKMWLGMPLERFEATVNGAYDRHFVPKGGIVWTPSELRSQFGMSDAQIGLYQEFRAAVDQSINDLAKTEMVNRNKDLAPEVRAAALAAKDADSAGILVRDFFFDLAAKDQANADRWNEAGNDAIALANKAQGLIDRGYAPLMRFGKYTVYATREGGKEQVYFGIFESEADANKMARELAAQEEGVQIQQGVLSEEAFKVMSGMTPDTLELFAELTGADRTEAFADFIKLSKNNRSAMKRLLERKGVAGFSTDASRVLASFLTSNARAASGNLHLGEMREAAADIPKEQGDVKDEAIKLMEYVQNPIDEAAKIRGLLFFQYIGGSVASAAVNLTQPMTMTFPYLAQFVGAGSAGRGLARAMKDAMGKSIEDPDLKAALAKAEKEGLVSPQEIHQLQGEASRQFGNNVWIRRAQFLWGSLFGLAEQFNRKVTFIAAYRAAVEMENKSPYEFAAKAIEETQGIYNKANKPNWARGALGSTLFTFKQYSISYLEFMKRLPPKERALALAVLVVASGVQGLPFSDDLDDLIDTIAQGLGYNWNTKQQKTKFAAAVLGRDGAEFVMRGASALPGFPIDVAGRMGMSNLLPGTGLLLKSKQDKAGEVFEVMGPAGGVVRDLAKGEFLPIAVRNALKGAEMAETGWYKDAKHRNVLEVDGVEALAKGLGFQPARVARESRAVSMAQQNVALAKAVEADLADKMATARMEKDSGKYADAMADLREWNAKNPESRIRISSDQIARRVKEMQMGRSERVAKSAPREMRSQVRDAIAQ